MVYHLESEKKDSFLMKIAIINGPNLNLTGRREPEIYGHESMEMMYVDLQRRFPDVQFTYFQSNHEGDLIDKIQEYGFTADAIVLNAGGYTHTSVAIRDAVAAVPAPTTEVHLSDIQAREPFRKIDYLTDVCVRRIMGHGIKVYGMAVEKIINEA